MRRHARRQLDTELRQQRLHALGGERRLRGLVTGTIQTNHQTIADQLVLTHALDGRDLLQPLGMHRSAGQRQRARQQHQQPAGQTTPPGQCQA